MALYIPPSRGRRLRMLAALAGLVVGLGAGLVLGRASASTVGDQLQRSRARATELAAGLRVLALHEQAAAATASGDGGATLVLDRTATGLGQLFDGAPWLTAIQRDALNGRLAALRGRDPATAGFGTAADDLARAIETTVGGAG